MTHYAVANYRPIILSYLIKGLIFLIKRRDILDLDVEFKVRFYLLTKMNY